MGRCMGQILDQILTQTDGLSYEVINPDGPSPILFVCEHASKTIPPSLNGLGLDTAVTNSHVAWDPGAMAVARLLSQTFNASLIAARYSRLVYDCNRPPEAAGAMPAKSEIFEILGNQGITEAECAARIREIYEPFSAAISTEIASRNAPVLVTIHSFTPVYFGAQRHVELGILHDTDSRLADAMLKLECEMNVQRNAPYGPEDGVTHTLQLHALPNGLLNVMIEVRNDLIADEVGQKRVADGLANMLRTALSTLIPEITNA